VLSPRLSFYFVYFGLLSCPSLLAFSLEKPVNLIAFPVPGQYCTGYVLFVALREIAEPLREVHDHATD
jgi:hypothetical protein